VKEIYFNNRDGHTVLSTGERKGLKLKNISNMQELDEAEQMNINEGLLWLNDYKGEIFNDSFILKLHKKLFGEVWRWAGKYRQSEKNIGIAPWKVPIETHKWLDDSKYWIAENSYEWPELIARFHHRLVYIHPFANGNGRFARIFTNLVCERNQQDKISWRKDLEPQQRRTKYIEALRAADLKSFKALIEFMSH
jgi:Fic-DOC domain mobile mystery protein B